MCAHICQHNRQNLFVGIVDKVKHFSVERQSEAFFQLAPHVVSVPIGIVASKNVPNSRLIHPNTETWYDFRHRYIFLQHLATKCFGKCELHNIETPSLHRLFCELQNTKNTQ